jgi:peptidoglycan/xylan/chitin deacetylase (PgdA/CDA1 family)
MDRLIAHLATISPLNALAISLFGHYVTIYMLHRPSPQNKIYNGTCPVLLEKCLAYAQKKQFQFASLDELVLMAMKGEKPKKPTLCFTMDDGYLDQLTVLAPIFLKYNAKPTIFVLSDFSDNIDWPWDAKLIYLCQATSVPSVEININGETLSLSFASQEERIKSRRKISRIAKYLEDQQQNDFLDLLQNKLVVKLPQTAPKEFAPADWDSLRLYHKLGLNVGAHGKTHKVFNSLTDEKIREELRISRSRLFAEIPDASNVYCYSSGTEEDYSENHCPLVAEANFIAAVSAKPGNVTLSSVKQDLFNIKRHSFPSNLEKFIRYSSWVEYLRSKID